MVGVFKESMDYITFRNYITTQRNTQSYSTIEFISCDLTDVLPSILKNIINLPL